MAAIGLLQGTASHSRTRVTKPEDIERLVEKIVLPSDLQDPFSDGIHALTDRVAITYAAAVLFPFGARQILMEPFTDNKLSLAKIADMAELPPRYAALVMSVNGYQDPRIDGGRGRSTHAWSP